MYVRVYGGSLSLRGQCLVLGLEGFLFLLLLHFIRSFQAVPEMQERGLSVAQEADDAGTFNLDSRPRPTDVDVPPNGGIGWIQVGVCFTINCFAWGQIAVHISPSVVFAPLMNPYSPTVSISHTISPMTCFPERHLSTTPSSAASTSQWPCWWPPP